MRSLSKLLRIPGALHYSTAARFHAATSGKPLPDPHNVSNQLDKETIQEIVKRLESRGKDPVFQSLFNYFDRVPAKARVLEVGCGTGVMTRALSKHPGFTGHITGVDQCKGFLGVARDMAQKEGGKVATVDFKEGDAHDLQSAVGDNKFDVVVMHTLLSHATHPKSVLRSAASVAADDAKLIVMDGDYSSLSYGYSESWIGKEMNRALVTATFNRPNIIWDLISTLGDCGWDLKDSKATCVAEIGSQASFWVSFAECYAPRVKAAGLISDTIVDQWLLDQAENLNQGRFFASCNYYTLMADKQQLSESNDMQ